MRDGGKRSALRPLWISLAVFLLGALIIASTISRSPLGWTDRDGDGISDSYQEVRPVHDVVMVSEGEWTEVLVGYNSSLDLPFLAFVCLLCLLVLPVLSYLYVGGRERREASRRKWEEAAAMHDNVRRIAAFLETDPSLLSAVKSAHLSAADPDRRVLGKLLWDIRTSGRPFHASFDRFSDEWRSRDPMLGNALSSLMSAEREPSEEEARDAARRTVERLSDASREMMNTYIRALSAPSTALFGLGVLLPVLLATMIPLAGVGVRTALLLGFLLWAVLPLAVVHTGTSLAKKRPRFFGASPDPAPRRISPNFVDVLSLAAGGAFSVLSLSVILLGLPAPAFLQPIGLEEAEMFTLLLVLGAGFLISGTLDMYWREVEARRREEALLVSGIPDVLQGIGSSIADGRSFERSLEKASRSLKGPSRRALASMAPAPGLKGSGPGPGALFAALASAREFSRAGPEPGGRAIRALSRHLREIASLESDMREKVRSSIGQMEVTASIFAPIMVGSSAGIFKLMERSAPGAAGSAMVLGAGSGSAIDASGFILLSGGYLVLLSIATSVAFFRIENGSEKGGLQRAPKRVLQASLSFAGGVLGSYLLVG